MHFPLPQEGSFLFPPQHRPPQDAMHLLFLGVGNQSPGWGFRECQARARAGQCSDRQAGEVACGGEIGKNNQQGKAKTEGFVIIIIVNGQGSCLPLVN